MRTLADKESVPRWNPHPTLAEIFNGDIKYDVLLHHFPGRNDKSEAGVYTVSSIGQAIEGYRTTHGWPFWFCHIFDDAGRYVDSLKPDMSGYPPFDARRPQDNQYLENYLASPAVYVGGGVYLVFSDTENLNQIRNRKNFIVMISKRNA